MLGAALASALFILLENVGFTLDLYSILFFIAFPIVVIPAQVNYFPLIITLPLIATIFIAFSVVFLGYRNYKKIWGKALIISGGSLWVFCGLIGSYLSL